MKEQINTIISGIALTAYYVPIAIVLFRKMWKDVPILVFSLYWAVGGMINLLPYIIPTRIDEIVKVIFNNIIDVPFVMFIFYLNTTNKKMKHLTKLLIPVYIFIEIMNGLLRGFTDSSFKYLLGAGVIVTLILVLAEIIRYFQDMDSPDREKAKIFLYFAMLFEYASYGIVYVFTYFIDSPLTDRLVIYFASTLLGIAIACFGFASPYFKKKQFVQGPREHEVLITIID
ncbi:MAG: hypothetical protein EOO02_07840 [Chitinophagaceae bacterium]|nr:MAG: hypothetical protein EOO02_07840 [Chitinophagaceae bacterium]